MIKIFFKIYQKCKQDGVNCHAAQSALFLILSGIPFLIVILSLFQLTNYGMSDLYAAIRTVCPEYFHAFLVSLIDEMYDQSAGLLSVTAVIAIWSAAKGIQYMANGFNAIYGIPENRNWLFMRFWAIIYTMIFAVVFLLIMRVMLFQKTVDEILIVWLKGHTLFLFFTSWLRWLLLVFILVLFFCFFVFGASEQKAFFQKTVSGRVLYDGRMDGVFLRTFHLYQLF